MDTKNYKCIHTISKKTVVAICMIQYLLHFNFKALITFSFSYTKQDFSFI